MKLIQAEQIELSASEINALDIVRRIGEHLANGARDPEHRAKGEAIYKACASLDFVRSNEEDPNEPILRRRDLQCVYDGKYNIESLKSLLPSVCADLISGACDQAEQDGYDNGHDDGYADGYDDGYRDRIEEDE